MSKNSDLSDYSSGANMTSMWSNRNSNLGVAVTEALYKRRGRGECEIMSDT